MTWAKKEACITQKLGFGFLRLPYLDGEEAKGIDYDVLNGIVDRFLALGGTYFDTAYTYLNGLSEEALRKSLVERHPRDTFCLADKLPGYKVTKPEDCWAYFNEQLERCGVDYFDVYLLHWLNEAHYEICEKYDEFGFLRTLKETGKAHLIGFSYHDGPELLDRILSEHPEVDYVQLQINYLDWDSVTIQSAKCYEVAARHGKKVVVMEPVKGGSLAKLPEAAEQKLRAIHPGDSMASWAIRFASSLEQVEIVLSGMNAMEQLEDNVRDLPSLQEEEYTALAQIAQLIHSQTAVPCTGCGYCASHCTNHIPIPRFFALYNEHVRNPGDGWKLPNAYDTLAENAGRASDCIVCRQCEENCPQKLPISDFLKDVAAAFE